MDKFYQDLFGVLTRARPANMNRESKAASLHAPTKTKTKTEEMVVISTYEYNELTNQRPSKAASQSFFNGTKRIPKREYIELLMNAASRKSKAASISVNENKAQLIHNFVNRR